MQSKKNNKELNLTKFDFLFDFALIKPFRNQSVGGLEAPDQYEDKPEFGEVIKVGEGIRYDGGALQAPPVEVGDIVFFGKYTSEKVHNQGEDFLLVKLEDIRAVQ